MKLSLLAVISLFSVCALAKEPATTATFGVNSDYAMPLIEINREDSSPVLQRGILKDLGEAIFKELNLKPEWFLLPKKRVAPNLVSGQISILCHLNEVWQPKIKDDVWWSHELYRSANVLVFIKHRGVRAIKDLYGERVGVVLNFIYTSLDPFFTSGQIKREDGPNNQSNIQKLLKGRINYIVMSNLEYAYFKKVYPSLENIDLGMDVVMTKCAVSKKSALSIDKVNRAIDTIKSNGTLDKILRSY